MSRQYAVTFYHEVTGDNGHCRDMPIEVVEIDEAPTPEAAVAVAIRRFEADKRVLCWTSLATHFAVAQRSS